MRLNKYIAQAGICSRRKADEFIQNGQVKVNDKVITDMSFQVRVKDKVYIDNHLIRPMNLQYYKFNKPAGYITTMDDEKGRKTVIDLISTEKRLYPVGRLDYDTTGILLLTNDGELANLLMHPKNNIDKLYIAKVKGFVSKEALNKLINGVYIDNYKTSKSKVKLKKYDKKTNTSLVEIIIHEGKNHQVKKMFEAVGYEVLKLKREKISFLDLNGLKSGEYRYLTLKEVKKLYSEIKK